MLMLDTVLAFYLLLNITKKHFESPYLTEIYLVLDNIQRGISNMRNTDVNPNFFH
jgi:hypothetical protein